MKNYLLILTLLALSICSASAQTIAAADKKAIDESFAVFANAFQKGDASGISSLIAENAEQIIPTGEIIRGHDNIVNGLTSYMAYLKSIPQPSRTESKQLNRQDRYLTSNLILVTYTDEVLSYFGDTSTVEKNTTSILFQKTGGKWMVEMIVLTPVTGK